MTQGIKKFFKWVFILMGCIWFASCSEPVKTPEPEYIIKTSIITISIEDFNEELDLKMAAYSYNIKDQPGEYNEMVIHLVKVLSEEIILLSVAQDLGIVVADQAVDAAEAEMKKDYPEDSFELMLLKNAISYPFWKKRFKKNMVVDKLIDQELKKKIEISSQDIVEFYQKYANTSPQSSGLISGSQMSDQVSDQASDQASGQNGDEINNFQDEEQLVSTLRRQKTQDYYEEWILKLWNEYPVDIDKGKLKTFLIDIEISKEIKNEKEN